MRAIGDDDEVVDWRRALCARSGPTELVDPLLHLRADMYMDTIARFCGRSALPLEAFVDLLDIASDEARHFQQLEARMRELQSHYGVMPAHKVRGCEE